MGQPRIVVIDNPVCPDCKTPLQQDEQDQTWAYCPDCGFCTPKAFAVRLTASE